MSRISRHVLLIPALVAVAFHFPSLICQLVYDDRRLIIEHPLISMPAFILDIFSRDYGLEFADAARGFYRPAFTLLTFLIRQGFGPTPFAFHLVSLLTFCGASVLVALVTRNLFPTHTKWFAVAAGCIYASHPARVETVSLFSSLPDLLVEISALLVLMKMASLSTTSDASFKPKPLFLYALIALMAGLTKESAFFVLGALGATSILYGAMNHRPSRCFTTLGGVILFGLSLSWVLRQVARVDAPPVLPLMERLIHVEAASAVYSICMAAKEIVVPGPVVFWRLPSITTTGLTLLSLLLLTLFLAGLWFYFVANRRLPHSLLVAWFGAGTVTLILLTAGGYPYSQRYIAVAPAIIGLCVAAKAIEEHLTHIHLHLLERRLGKHVGILLVAAYISAHGAFALAGSIQCLTPRVFFTFMTEANPRDVIPLGALAQTVCECGTAEETESYVRKATSLDSTHPQVPILHNMLARRYLDDRRYEDALRVMNWSLNIYPDDPHKLALKAASLAYLGKLDQAFEAIQKAERISPGNAAIKDLLGQIETQRTRQQNH